MHNLPNSVAAWRQLAATTIDPIDADILLAHVLQKPRGWLFAHDDAHVDEAASRQFQQLLVRRQAGEPVAYLTGQRGFWTLDLLVSPATLIPRPETELLVEQALLRLPEQAACYVADLGTGSGAIALALAKERPLAQVVATDASTDALAMAKQNAQRNGIKNVSFRQGNWLEPLMSERFDVIASNPPYVAAGDPHLAQGDLRFEPAMALSSGTDGLSAIRTIALDARSHLYLGGWLLLEHGWEQGAAIRHLLQQAGYTDVSTVQDLEARDRVTLGCYREGV